MISIICVGTTPTQGPDTSITSAPAIMLISQTLKFKSRYQF